MHKISNKAYNNLKGIQNSLKNLLTISADNSELKSFAAIFKDSMDLVMKEIEKEPVCRDRENNIIGKHDWLIDFKRNILSEVRDSEEGMYIKCDQTKACYYLDSLDPEYLQLVQF